MNTRGMINYHRETRARPRYYANDHSRDLLDLEPHDVMIHDARSGDEPASLLRQGFQLYAHHTEIIDFKDAAAVAAVHAPEIEALLLHATGADRVAVGDAGVLRFGEKSQDAGKFNNSLPARFIHVDLSDSTARRFAVRSEPAVAGRGVRRFAHYNVWRALSPPPQDIPLAVCDARTVGPHDLMAADAVFDVPGTPEWSFEGWVVRYNPAHRWSYFSGMSRNEVLVFKTNDSDRDEPLCVPHCAFDDPSCPARVPPRVSIEMRGTAYWLA